MNQLAILQNFHEAGILRFLSGGIKARRAERYVIRLPLAGATTRVEPGSVAFEAGAIFPTLINAAAIVRARFLYAPAIEHLQFITALKIDAGIGIGRHTKLDVRLHVSM